MRLFFTGLTLQLFLGILMPLLITSFGTYSSNAFASDGSQEASASDVSQDASVSDGSQDASASDGSQEASSSGDPTAPMVFKRFAALAIDVQIDGKLDESIWSQIEGFDNMRVVSPDTLKEPGSPSLIRIFYTEKGLYFGIKCTQAPDTLVARLTSRDTTINRDGVSFIIDPSGRGLFSYWFKVNLGGTLVDGIVLPEKRLSVEWDGPWYGAASETSDGWSAEMYLPWSMMSMPSSEKIRTMAFYVSRKVAHLDEMWSYPALPETNGIFLSGFRHAQFEGINPKQQYALYPYTSATYDRIEEDMDYRAGFDVDWRPSSNFQLTATINPDFGQVESDDVVVNLSAFETYFPERRLFFLEGYEIFVTNPRAANGNVNMVNTRRIGGAPRAPVLPAGGQIPDLARSQPTDLFGAVKLTGQQGKIRYGVLAALEDDTRFDGTLEDNVPFTVEQDGRDFGIMRLLYEDTDTGGRRSIGWMSTAVLHPEADAFVHGVDLHYLSQDKKLSWDAQLLTSEADKITGAGGFFDMRYIPTQGTIHDLGLEYFDDKLDIGALGYLRQNNVIGFSYNFQGSRSDLPHLRNRTTRISYLHGHSTNGDLVRSGLVVGRDYAFLDNSGLSIDLNYAPARWDDRNSYGNGSFRIKGRGSFTVNWYSDSSKKISYGLGANVMSEDLHGTIKNYNANLELRPSDRLSLLLNIAYSDRDGWLLHQSEKTFTTYEAKNWYSALALDVFLTAKQQFRISTQWAAYKAYEQDFYEISPDSGDLIPYAKPPGSAEDDFAISELTFQARYRWQIAPLSDLYLVYTRGSNLPSDPSQNFGSLFSDAWSDPIVDTIVFKLRYRFGN